MRIICVGGGPAGLYFAVLAKLADPAHEVTVLERNPAGVTYGWGVVFWDDLLDDLFRYDPVSARMIWDAACQWDEYEVRATGKAVDPPGRLRLQPGPADPARHPGPAGHRTRRRDPLPGRAERPVRIPGRRPRGGL